MAGPGTRGFVSLQTGSASGHSAARARRQASGQSAAAIGVASGRTKRHFGASGRCDQVVCAIQVEYQRGDAHDTGVAARRRAVGVQRRRPAAAAALVRQDREPGEQLDKLLKLELSLLHSWSIDASEQRDREALRLARGLARGGSATVLLVSIARVLAG